MTRRDYYEILGVEKGCDINEIKGSYRKLALKYHPDRNPDDAESEEKFKEATEAYEVLSDPDKRARYDRYGHDGVRRGQDFGNYSNINDIFSMFSDIFSGGSIFDEFFGNSRKSGRRNIDQGSDIRIKLPLTMEEIGTGTEKTIKLKRYIVCEECSGSGAKRGSNLKTCPACNGSGEQRQVSRSIFGQFVNISACTNCSGSGKIIAETCHKCKGEGRIQAEDTVKVNIPAGVETGNYIPVRSKGNAGRRSGLSGDLIIVIEEKEHEIFRRHENNVIYHTTVNFAEATLGAEIEVPTLYGVEKLKIEPGTQPGTVLTMKEKGIPNLNSYGKGNQIVYVNVYVPQSLNTKDKAIIRELAQSPNINPKKKHSDKKVFFEKVKNAFN